MANGEWARPLTTSRIGKVSRQAPILPMTPARSLSLLFLRGRLGRALSWEPKRPLLLGTEYYLLTTPVILEHIFLEEDPTMLHESDYILCMFSKGLSDAREQGSLPPWCGDI